MLSLARSISFEPCCYRQLLLLLLSCISHQPTLLPSTSFKLMMTSTPNDGSVDWWLSKQKQNYHTVFQTSQWSNLDDVAISLPPSHYIWLLPTLLTPTLVDWVQYFEGGKWRLISTNHCCCWGHDSESSGWWVSCIMSPCFNKLVKCFVSQTLVLNFY